MQITFIYPAKIGRFKTSNSLKNMRTIEENIPSKSKVFDIDLVKRARWKTRSRGPGVWKTRGRQNMNFPHEKWEAKILLAYIAMNINSASRPETRCSIKKQIKHFVIKKTIQEPMCRALVFFWERLFCFAVKSVSICFAWNTFQCLLLYHLTISTLENIKEKFLKLGLIQDQ